MKLTFLTKLPAEMLPNIKEIRVPVVNPTSLLPDGCQGMGGGAPTFSAP